MAKEVKTITISNVKFTCVKLEYASFTDIAAIYVILCKNEKGKFNVLDVGESGELGTRIGNHDREKCWKRNCPTGDIWVCVYPMPTAKYTKKERLEFEQQIRDEYDPPCGKR